MSQEEGKKENSHSRLCLSCNKIIGTGSRSLLFFYMTSLRKGFWGRAVDRGYGVNIHGGASSENGQLLGKGRKISVWVLGKIQAENNFSVRHPST